MSNRTDFNFFDISKLRLELMGVGTLLILLCHSVGNNVKMSGFLAKIADNGQIGVDLFLFLSGLGLSFSLNRTNWTLDKEVWLSQWYKKRFERVLYPYFLIAIPYLLYKLFWGELSIVRGLTNLLTIDWWFFGGGAWFVSLILVLYIFAPLLYIIFQSKYKWIWAICLSLFLMFLCNDYVDGCLKYVSIAFRRVPSFILGMAIAAEVMNKRKISLFKILGLSFIPFVLISIYLPFVYCRWLIIIPLIVLLCSLISVSNRGTRLLSFMGMISIESYLANIFIGDILNHKSWIISGIDLSYGHYLEYFTVLFFGILIAYCVNSFVKQKK